MQIVPQVQAVELGLDPVLRTGDMLHLRGAVVDSPQTPPNSGTTQCVPVAWLQGGDLAAGVRAIPYLRVLNVGGTGRIFGAVVWLRQLPITDPSRGLIDQRVTGSGPVDAIIVRATIDWGDGTPPYITSSPFDAGTVQHLYAATGAYKIRVTVELVDDEPGMVSTSRSLIYERIHHTTRPARTEFGQNPCTNPILATDDTGWSAGPGATAGARVAATTERPDVEWAYEVQPTATTSSIVMPRQAVRPGDTWAISAYCAGITAADTAHIGVTWYDGDDPIAGMEIDEPARPLLAGDFTQIGITNLFEAPAGADNMVPCVLFEVPAEELGAENVVRATAASYSLQDWVDVTP